MRPQTDFATRINTVNKAAEKSGIMRSRAKPRIAGRLVTPLMIGICALGGVTAAWDVQERPTDTPFEYVSALSSQLLAYVSAI